MMCYINIVIIHRCNQLPIKSHLSVSLRMGGFAHVKEADMKKTIFRKLTSRKLWMSISSFVMMLLVFFGYSENKAVQVASLVMAGGTVIAYVIGEGLADSSPYFLGENESEEEEVIEDEGN